MSRKVVWPQFFLPVEDHVSSISLASTNRRMRCGRYLWRRRNSKMSMLDGFAFVEGWGRHRVGDPHRQWTAETAELLKLFYRNKDYKMNRGYFLYSVKLYRLLYKQNLSLSWHLDLRYTLLQVVCGRFNVLSAGWRYLSLPLKDVLFWIWNQVISNAPDYCNTYYKPQNLERRVTERLPDRTYKLKSLVHRSGPPPANNHHKNKTLESVLSLVGS